MKKLLGLLPKFILSTSLIIAVGCNSGTTTEESTTDSVGNSPGGNTLGTISGDSAGVVDPGQTNDAIATMTDTGFISKNIMDNMMEISLAKLGREKGDAQVKKVSAQMITEHTLMLNYFKALAGKKQVAIPAANMSDTAMMGIMKRASGKEFVNAWAGHMLTMHEAKIAELESALDQTQDADIKALINKGLPKIKMHRDMIAKISEASVNTQ